MNNIHTGLPGVDRAISTLKASGYVISWCIWGGYSVVNPAAQTRRDGVTTFELIDLAKQVEATLNANQPQ